MSEMNTDEETPNEEANTEDTPIDEGHEKNGLDVVMCLADTSGVTDENGMTVTEGIQVMNGHLETDVLTDNDGVTKQGDVTDACSVTQHSQVTEDSISKKQGNSGKETSLKQQYPIEEGTNPPLLDLVDSKELGLYLSNLWDFETLTQEQEKNAVIFQPQVLDDLELPASLECQAYALRGGEGGKQSGKDLLLNAGSKTPVAILHEYCQRVLKTKPVYMPSECESADTPFMAEVQIDGIKYGSGTGSNKKVAKQVAAEATLEVLLPGVFKKVRDYQISEAELEVGF